MLSRFVLSSMLLLATTGQVSAEDGKQEMPPIRRLFGVELGKRVTEYKALGDTVVETGFRPAPEWIQPIAPPEPNSLFRDYQVSFNPETREIYRISAQSSMSDNECEATISLLSEVIKKQYEGYKIREEKRFIVVDRREPGDMFFPYDINCSLSELRISVFDEKAYKAHMKQNKDRSPVSAKGL